MKSIYPTSNTLILDVYKRQAMGVELKDRGITQVSMNLTDYSKTAIYRAFELVRFESKRYGVSIIGSEIVGLVPMEALIDTSSYYLGLENFSMQQVLEAQIMDCLLYTSVSSV